MVVHLSPVRIQGVKERWEREVLAGLQRQERRLDRARDALTHTLVVRPRATDERQPGQLLPLRATARRDGPLELLATARRSVRLVRSSGQARRWLEFGRRRSRWQDDPERAARRAVFRLATQVNYIVRVYRPRVEIRNGTWKLREAAPVK